MLVICQVDHSYNTVRARVYIDRGDLIMGNVLLILYPLFTGEKETNSSYFITHLSLAVLVLEVVAINITLSGEERTLACPGQPVHYTCISPRVTTITWHLLCQDQQRPAFTPPVDMEMNTTHHHLPCTSANGGMVSYDLTLTFASNDSTTESNISITVLEIADSVTQLNSLRISCESQDSYKYLDVTGMLHIVTYLL